MFFRLPLKHRLHCDAALRGHEEANFQSDVGNSVSHRCPVGFLFINIFPIYNMILLNLIISGNDVLYFYHQYLLLYVYFLQFREVSAFQIVQSLFVFIFILQNDTQNFKVIKMQLS